MRSRFNTTSTSAGTVIGVQLGKALALSGVLLVVAAGTAQKAGAQPAQKPAAKSTPGAQRPDTAPPKPPEPKRASTVQMLNDEDILVAPGDVIQIQVVNHPALDGAYPIPGVGKLLLPEAGEVLVAGYTVGQIRDHIQTQLEKTLNNVFVRVLLKEVHSRHASITGIVQHQGTFDMSTNEYHVLDLLDMAGGLAPPTYRSNAALSEYVATLYRGKAIVPIDLTEANSHPDGPANFVVQPSDRITVTLLPNVTHEVHILGKIPRQGAYPLDNNTTVLGLFGQAGYPDTASSLSTAYVLRGVEKLPLDLRPLLTGNVDLSVNRFKFQDGDILYIPEVKTQFMVWGQVGRQGNYPYPEAGKVYLLDAITNSGQTPNGEYRHVHLLRTVDGKQTDKDINVDKMIRKGLKDENILLQPGDIVFVPPKKHIYTPGINDIFTPIALLNLLGLHPFL